MAPSTSSTTTTTTRCTGTENRNQVLLVRSTNGGHSFSAPVKVGDYYDLPDCATYQGTGSDPGRDCVPEKGTSTNSVFRADNYPIGAVDPTDPNRVVVTYGSYINRDSNEARGCTPGRVRRRRHQPLHRGEERRLQQRHPLQRVRPTAAPTSPAAAIDPRQLPVVTDSPNAGQHRPVLAGRRVHRQRHARRVSYYDRSYGDDNTTGYSDITVSASHDRTTLRRTSGRRRPRCRRRPSSAALSTATTPGLAVTNTTAYPIWSDTRAVDQFLCPGTGTPDHTAHRLRRRRAQRPVRQRPRHLHRRHHHPLTQPTIGSIGGDGIDTPIKQPWSALAIRVPPQAAQKSVRERRCRAAQRLVRHPPADQAYCLVRGCGPSQTAPRSPSARSLAGSSRGPT